MAERYVTYAEFDQYFRSDTTVDINLKRAAVDAATVALDNQLGRKMIVAPVPGDGEDVEDVAETRVYRPSGQVLVVDDFVELVSLVENGSTLTNGTDFVLEPLNGLSAAGEAVPYDRAVRYGQCWYEDWPKPTVAVTARFGWEAIPPQIVEACKVLAKEVLENRDVRLGIVAVTDAAIASARTNKVVADAVRTYQSVRKVGIA